jgi:putative tryptophan/tyrosine transport system substrate-binding protein
MKKRLSFALFLGAVFIFTFAANALAKDVGVAWVGKSGMAKRVFAGFEKGMKEFGQDIKLEFHKELGSLDDLVVIVDKYQKEKDGMVILRSNGAKWLGKNPPTIPTFIGGCNNPVQLGALQNMNAPEGKITGVTYFLPVATQFETFKAILPDMKSVLLLLGAGNPSAEVDKSETKEVCANLGLEYNVKVLATKEDALKTVRENKDKVSMIIIGNQAEIMDGAKDLVVAAGKTPVVSYSSKPVKDGALGGFVADDQILGYMLAQSVVEVLSKGMSVSAVPVKVDPNPKFFVNAKTAQTLGIEIPYEVLQAAEVIE